MAMNSNMTGGQQQTGGRVRCLRLPCYLLQENDFRSTFDESTRIERQYKQYFDEMIVNDNMDETYNKLRRAIEKLSTKHQWVPVNWVY